MSNATTDRLSSADATAKASGFHTLRHAADAEHGLPERVVVLDKAMRKTLAIVSVVDGALVIKSGGHPKRPTTVPPSLAEALGKV